MNMTFAQELMANFTFEGQEKALAMYADDAVFEDFTFGFRVEGMEQLKGLFAAFFDPARYQHQFTALSYAGDAQGGAIEYASKMRTPGDFMGVETGGRELTIRGTAVVTFRDGKITRFADYWDAASVLRQLDPAQ